MSNDFFNFNNAGEQRSVDVIPANTICTVQLNVRAGGAGDDGWLRRSKDGSSEALDCEFTIVDGEYVKRKVWALYTVRGTTPGHAEAAEISRKSLCAMLESARGVRPDDKSEAAQKARQAAGWADFDGLRLVVRIGVRPPEGTYPAKNTILEVVTPEKQAWRRVEQLPPGAASRARAAIALTRRRRRPPLRRRAPSRARNGRGDRHGRAVEPRSPARRSGARARRGLCPRSGARAVHPRVAWPA